MWVTLIVLRLAMFDLIGVESDGAEGEWLRNAPQPAQLVNLGHFFGFLLRSIYRQHGLVVARQRD